MSRKWLVPGVILGALLLVVLIITGSYNGLVSKREDVRKTFANVQTQYQRRADLVPNLVNTVKGAANFEQKTLTDVTNARAKATSINIDPSTATPQQLQQYQQSQGELSQALGRLLAVTENYPQLTATAGFRDLQVQLEGTENRIAVSRRDYNEVLNDYNARIKRFPTNITAGIFGFDAFPYFQADEGSENAPTVDFGQ
ncbi:MAG: LemA family protein [Candidatus Saccharibacteria bacterium]|nr:LemA family protein [Candidatus Saccharibacteria bacterium]